MSKIAIQGNPLGSGLFTITSANSNSDYAITIPAQTGTLVLGDGSGGLSLSGSLTLSGGTANGVLYLNGSKVATSGSALTFDGTNLGIGTSSPGNPLTVRTSGTSTSVGGNIAARIESNGSGYASTLQFSDNVANSSYISMVGSATAFGQAGTERMRIDSGGNVGIGTSSPASELHVAVTGNIRGSSSASDSLNLYGGVSGTANRIQIRGPSHPSTPNIITFDANSAERMRIDSSGNVGIGTSSPASNSVTIANKTVAMTNGYGMSWNSGSAQYAGYDSNILQFITSSAERMRIDSSGNVGIGTSSPSGRLHVASSAGNLPLYVTSSAASQNVRIRLNSSDTTSSVAYVWSYSDASLNKQASIYFTGTGGLATQVGQTAGSEPTSGTLASFIDSSGNVGIGTSSPSAKLQVVGNVMAGNGTAATPAYHFVGSSAIGMFTPDAGFSIAFSTGSTERMRIDSSGNLLFNSGYGSVATAYGCRAWVNFNGTGTVAIRASGNVSSITDNGTGDYTVNFTSALVDANYAVSIGGVKNDTNPDGNFRATFGQTNTLPSTSGFRVVTAYATGGNQDFPAVACAVFR